MEHNPHTHEERLFDLLESKDFDQLTSEERAFVTTHLSEVDYRLQRRMITEAGAAYSETPEPAPLVLPAASSFTGKTVPLYQALMAVAATVLLFLVLWPSEPVVTQNPETGNQQLVHTDTVIRTKIITDTVIRYVKQRERSQAMQSDDASDRIIRAEAVRLLEAAPAVLPEITEELIRTRGSSMKNDSATRRLLENMYQADAR